MGRLTDLLLTFFILRSTCGRGPTLFGFLLALSIPVGLLLVLIGVLYPLGLAGFVEQALWMIVLGLH